MNQRNAGKTAHSRGCSHGPANSCSILESSTWPKRQLIFSASTHELCGQLAMHLMQNQQMDPCHASERERHQEMHTVESPERMCIQHFTAPKRGQQIRPNQRDGRCQIGDDR